MTNVAAKEKTIEETIEERPSSLRTVPPSDTLAIAQLWAADAGISRVTDISGLDFLGVPVYAGIRPAASPDAVTYGKGMVPIDAQIGAYMESIEFHFAEPDSNHQVQVHWGTAADVAASDSEINSAAILNYCPVANREIDLDSPLLLAHADDIETGKKALIPAELVFHPAKDVGQPIFGSSTNGLASGNNRLEAAFHALCELIERDIWSFETISDSSHFVSPEGLPDEVSQIMAKVAAAGLEMVIRNVPNDYDLPFFSVWLFDPKQPLRAFFNSGWGCHPHSRIALVRAVCEAVQSRAAVIHGARGFALPVEHQGAECARHSVEILKRDEASPIQFADVVDHASSASLEIQWQQLLLHLRKVTKEPIYCVYFTPENTPLQVLRLVVPTLENYKPGNWRIGQRLKTFLESR